MKTNQTTEAPPFSVSDSSACLIYVGHAMLAALFTLFFIHLTGSRWAYYDIGLNAAANSWTLIFLVGPMIFTGLLAGAAVSWSMARRYELRGWRLLLAGIMSMIIVFGAAFLFDVWRTIDYPNPFNRTLPDFLTDYLGQWLR